MPAAIGKARGPHAPAVAGAECAQVRNMSRVVHVAGVATSRCERRPPAGLPLQIIGFSVLATGVGFGCGRGSCSFPDKAKHR